MKQEIGDTGLWVGDRPAGQTCVRDNDWAVVNTSKVLHAQLVGVPQNQLKRTSHYLRLEREGLLSFNMIDGEARYFQMLGPEAFVDSLDFIDHWRGTRAVLVNCDRGMSRSPTVAMLYLAKRLHLLPDASFVEALLAFRRLYPNYDPGGVGKFVSMHWASIL
ncbi:MAG: hypothetical protein ACHQFZ_05195 [Acidimicrobiales bacterium]